MTTKKTTAAKPAKKPAKATAKKLNADTAIAFKSDRPTGVSKDGPKGTVFALVPRKGSIKFAALLTAAEKAGVTAKTCERVTLSLVKYGRLEVG